MQQLLSQLNVFCTSVRCTVLVLSGYFIIIYGVNDEKKCKGQVLKAFQSFLFVHNLVRGLTYMGNEYSHLQQKMNITKSKL